MTILLDCHLQNQIAIPAAVAVGTSQVDVAEELHFDVLEAVAVTGGAPAFAAVKAERAGAVTAFASERLPGEELTNLVERADVAGRVGACGLTDGRLVHHHDVFDLLVAGNAVVATGLFGRLVFQPK